MGGKGSKVSTDQIVALAEKHSYNRKKLALVWGEFLHAKFNGVQVDSSASPQNTKLDFDDFTRFCDMYNFGVAGDPASLKPVFDAFDKNHDGLVSFEEVITSLVVLEQGSPEEKLELLFQAYSPNGEPLDVQSQLGPVIAQIVATARALGQSDTAGLENVVMEMLLKLDTDANGRISRDEWIRGGCDTVPLLVLLGIEQRTYNLQRVTEGSHSWRYEKKSSRARLCYRPSCSKDIKGEYFSCDVCFASSHVECAPGPRACMAGTDPCRRTCVPDGGQDTAQGHWWVQGYYPERCKCDESCKQRISVACAWCKRVVHAECKDKYFNDKDPCDLGQLRQYILPSTSYRAAHWDGHSTYDDLQNPMRIVPVPGSKPVIVFLNSGSGGGQGTQLLRKFSYMLNPRQVFDLQRQPPLIALKQYVNVPGVVLLACGGDGTAGWIMSELDKCDIAEDCHPPMAILPLGTGNDLARCFDWGGGYRTNEPLVPMLRSIDTATLERLDRWSIEFEPLTGKGGGTDRGDTPPLNIINNYFSIGVDAGIAHKFHHMRETYPEKFNSRSRNKLWYAELGASELWKKTCENMHKSVTVECDGQDLKIINGKQLQGLAVLNILTMYGGQTVWKQGGKFPHEQEMDDGLCEVVGLKSSTHVGAISAGLGMRGKRLAQCKECVITTTKALPMQIDGEPWIQAPCRIVIKFHNHANMLRPSDSKVPRSSESESGFLSMNQSNMDVVEEAAAATDNQ